MLNIAQTTVVLPWCFSLFVAAAPGPNGAEGGAVRGGLGLLPRPDAAAVTTDDAEVCPECSRSRAMLRRLAMGRGAVGPARLGGGGETDGVPAPDPTDVLNYALDLTLDFTSSRFVGVQVITTRSTGNGLTTFDIELATAFTITSMTIGGTAVAWTRPFGDQRITVTLNRAYSAGEQFDLRIAYNGTPPGGLDGIAEFTTHSGQAIAYTLAEPWFTYMWMPCKERNADKATADLWFTVPSTMNVAANGTLVGTDALGSGLIRQRWRTNYATSPYLLCFSATNYNTFSGTWTNANAPGGQMPLRFFIYPESDSTGNRNAWLATADMLTTFSNLFGPYPFLAEKYGVYQFPFGGGMEHQTITGQGTFSSSVTSHELTHQWFGDMITCDTWGDIWLNEGFATYGEALWLEFRPGSTGTAALLSAMNSRRPTSLTSPVYVFDTSNANNLFGTAQYRKGGWVLHMLRHVVGDTEFFAMLRNYRAAYAYRTATTADFIAICEGVHGSSLGWFFTPWLYSPGAAQYEWASRNVSAGGRAFVEVMIRQVQSTAYPTYTMPIDVRMTIGGTATDARITSSSRTAEWRLVPVSALPTAISLDPDRYVLETGKAAVTFAEGPPKVIAVSPAPGSSAAAGAVGFVDVTFHKNVSAPAAAFTLQRNGGAALPVSVVYTASTTTARMTPTSSLAPGVYTLTVLPTVTDTASGQALDGELASSSSPASLPSGNGTPGGAAVVTFTITPVPGACVADIVAVGGVQPPDGILTGDDFVAFINAFAAGNLLADIVSVGGSPPPDGVITGDDFIAFTNSFAAGCP